ncbi:hypothetical protein AA106555_0430 [Neokomagataea thailandica NBRC 106555]|nr:hypothetical protein AA106555_0430 [Neokomagataea thailandica NBRC 106555]
MPPPESAAQPSFNAVNTEAVTGIWLPLGERTPVAMFQEGHTGVLIARGEFGLDTLGSLAVGAFAPVKCHVLPGVTVITMTIPDGLKIGAKPQGAGWEISTASPVQADMSLGRWEHGLSFSPPDQDTALDSVQIDDPVSGRRLLVGMARSGRVAFERNIRGNGYAVKPSLIGLVVAADDDAIELRHLSGRFILDRIGAGTETLFALRNLPDSGASMNAVSLGDASPQSLKDSLRDAWFAVSAASPGEKLNTRIRLAESTARLGLAAQTDQILRTIVQDEPEAAGRSDVRRLQQIASVLLGRVRDEALLDDGGTAPEDQFWRGMMRTLPTDPRNGSKSLPFRLSDAAEKARTAQMIAAGLPALSSYSAPLKAGLFGPAALWIAHFGDETAQKLLGNGPDVPEKALAQAIWAVRQNLPDADQELAALTHSASPRIWPEAKLMKIERDLSKGRIAEDAATRELGSLMPGFRMAGIGAAAQSVLLETQLHAGQMRDALTAFLQTKPHLLLPKEETVLGRIAQGMLDHVPEDMGQKATEAALLNKVLTQNAFVPKATQRVLRYALAERYRALGLPFDERDTLRQIEADGVDDAARKRLARLVELDLATGAVDVAEKDLANFPKAGAASFGVAAPESAPDVQLACLQARLLKAQGKISEALAILQPLTDPLSYALQGEFAEEIKDWTQAEAGRMKQIEAMLGHATPNAALTKPQAALILQAAGDASRAHDAAAQGQLWARYRSAMIATSSAELFRILTGHAAED